MGRRRFLKRMMPSTKRVTQGSIYEWFGEGFGKDPYILDNHNEQMAPSLGAIDKKRHYWVECSGTGKVFDEYKHVKYGAFSVAAVETLRKKDQLLDYEFKRWIGPDTPNWSFNKVYRYDQYKNLMDADIGWLPFKPKYARNCGDATKDEWDAMNSLKTYTKPDDKFEYWRWTVADGVNWKIGNIYRYCPKLGKMENFKGNWVILACAPDCPSRSGGNTDSWRKTTKIAWQNKHVEYWKWVGGDGKHWMTNSIYHYFPNTGKMSTKSDREILLSKDPNDPDWVKSDKNACYAKAYGASDHTIDSLSMISEGKKAGEMVMHCAGKGRQADEVFLDEHWSDKLKRQGKDMPKMERNVATDYAINKVLEKRSGFLKVGGPFDAAKLYEDNGELKMETFKVEIKEETVIIINGVRQGNTLQQMEDHELMGNSDNCDIVIEYLEDWCKDKLPAECTRANKRLEEAKEGRGIFLDEYNSRED